MVSMWEPKTAASRVEKLVDWLVDVRVEMSVGVTVE